jgi:UPF0716 protein FxsA
MPLYYLIALFIGLPALELVVLIKLHGVIGMGPTILLILLTGIVGAALVRRQGMAILFRIRSEMSMGNLPAPQMMDGIMVLLAGALLITPGLITDCAGFALLIPPLRAFIRSRLRKILEKKLRSGYIEVHVDPPSDK